MQLSQWSERAGDRTRLKRLWVGYVVGSCLIVGATSALAFGPEREQEEEDGSIDVAFVAEVENEEPEPEQEQPEPESEPLPPQPAAAAPALPQPTPATGALPELETPDEIPDGPVEEKDPGAASGRGAVDPYGDPNAKSAPGGTGNGNGIVAPTPPPPPPPPPPRRKKKKLRRLTEGMTPPKALSQGRPTYPEAMRDQGVEGTVIVRYVVTTAGNTARVRAVRGPVQLRALCVAAVKRWRFKPALDAQGVAVAVPRTARFPFRIRSRR